MPAWITFAITTQPIMKTGQVIDPKKIGNRILLLSWSMVFVIETVVILAQEMTDGQSLQFKDIFDIWKITIPFVLLCIVHNYAVAPLLVRKNNIWAYLGAATLAFLAFSAMLLAIMPQPPMQQPAMQQPIMQQPIIMDKPMPMGPQFHGPGPKGMAGPPAFQDNNPGQFQNNDPKPPLNNVPRPLKPTILLLTIGFLVILVNLGAQFLLKGLSDKERTRNLEQENLEYRLKYLRAQISPHFFMNTLNNIHALVDIDADKAKECIVELSKMMRHVLYESSAKLVPLSTELEFIGHYVALMRIRYTDSVHISTVFPDGETSAQIPPMILATLMENSFKHGICSDGESFVEMNIVVTDGKIIVKCSNSYHSSPESGGSDDGIGMENIQGRLQLLYSSNFVMEYGPVKDRFETLLVIPAGWTTEEQS